MEPYPHVHASRVSPTHQHSQLAATGTVFKQSGPGRLPPWVDNLTKESEMGDEQDAHNQTSQSDYLAPPDEDDIEVDTTTIPA